jgi:hypothetical protein
MDTQWQSETDQALNALRGQLAKVRALNRGLVVAVLALAVWAVIGIVHKPTSIVLKGPDGSLKLEPDEISLEVGTSKTTIELDGMWFRNKDGAGERTAHLEGGELTMMAYPKASTVSSSMVELTALDKHVGLTMLANPQSVNINVSESSSELAVNAAHDKGVSVEATPTGAKVTGIGANLFGIGDGFTSPQAPAKP